MQIHVAPVERHRARPRAARLRRAARRARDRAAPCAARAAGAPPTAALDQCLAVVHRRTGSAGASACAAPGCPRWGRASSFPPARGSERSSAAPSPASGPAWTACAAGRAARPGSRGCSTAVTCSGRLSGPSRAAELLRIRDVGATRVGGEIPLGAQVQLERIGWQRRSKLMRLTDACACPYGREVLEQIGAPGAVGARTSRACARRIGRSGIAGNRPKFTFIGWKRFGSAPMQVAHERTVGRGLRGGRRAARRAPRRRRSRPPASPAPRLDIALDAGHLPGDVEPGTGAQLEAGQQPPSAHSCRCCGAPSRSARTRPRRGPGGRGRCASARRSGASSGSPRGCRASPRLSSWRSCTTA